MSLNSALSKLSRLITFLVSQLLPLPKFSTFSHYILNYLKTDQHELRDLITYQKDSHMSFPTYRLGSAQYQTLKNTTLYLLHVKTPLFSLIPQLPTSNIKNE